MNFNCHLVLFCSVWFAVLAIDGQKEVTQILEQLLHSQGNFLQVGSSQHQTGSVTDNNGRKFLDDKPAEAQKARKKKLSISMLDEIRDAMIAEKSTMVGSVRLDNVRDLLARAINNQVEGDFLEAGSWRGGTSIMARATQMAMDEGMKRRVYLCDSFEWGLPPATSKIHSKGDENGQAWSSARLAKGHSLSVDEVAARFQRHGLLDPHVNFVKGYFRYSMPALRGILQSMGRKLSVVRCDGDMFESYMDVLYNMYDLISPGGFFICDDCAKHPDADKAILQFRRDNGITEPLNVLNNQGTKGVGKHSDVKFHGWWWQKEHEMPIKYDKYIKWNNTRSVERTQSSGLDAATSRGSPFRTQIFRDLAGEGMFLLPYAKDTHDFQRITCSEAARQFKEFERKGEPVIITGCDWLQKHVPKDAKDFQELSKLYSKLNEQAPKQLPDDPERQRFQVNIWVPPSEMEKTMALPPFWNETSEKIPDFAVGTVEDSPMLAKYIVSNRGGHYPLHRDMHRDNLEYVLSGQKYVTLVPPTYQNVLHLHLTDMKDHRAKDPTAGRGTQYANPEWDKLSDVYSGFMEAGEMIYLPADWLHWFKPGQSSLLSTAYCWRRTSMAADNNDCMRMESLMEKIFSRPHGVGGPGAAQSLDLPTTRPEEVSSFLSQWTPKHYSTCPIIAAQIENLMRRYHWPKPSREWLSKQLHGRNGKATGAIL